MLISEAVACYGLTRTNTIYFGLPGFLVLFILLLSSSYPYHRTSSVRSDDRQQLYVNSRYICQLTREALLKTQRYYYKSSVRPVCGRTNHTVLTSPIQHVSRRVTASGNVNSGVPRTQYKRSLKKYWTQMHNSSHTLCQHGTILHKTAQACTYLLREMVMT